MSLDVLNQVWAADMAFLRAMYLLDADFFRFVWGLLQQPEAAGPATAPLAVYAGTKVSRARRPGARMRCSLVVQVLGDAWGGKVVQASK